MVDHLNEDMRSWNMSRIRSRHTKPEVIVRSLLHRLGYRFRINDIRLPGCPDIVMPKYKTVIFVHGCFWHRHKDCPKATTPGTNKEYWTRKFKNNISRDNKIKKELEKLKWRVITIWECQVISNPFRVINKIISTLGEDKAKLYSIDLDRVKILKFAEERSKYLINREIANYGK